MKGSFLRAKKFGSGHVKNNKGFTLLEVLISVVILSVIITPILAVFTSAFKTTVISQNLLDGAYIAQNVYENLVAEDYDSLLTLPAAKALFDSDGDGADDCYVQKKIYPDGVYSDLTTTSSPSYLHINIIGDQAKMLGSSGTSDTANVGSQSVAMGDISITNSSYSSTVTVQVSGSQPMTFTKKYDTCPLVVIVNIYNKKVNSPNITLTLYGDTSDLYIVEYARKSNHGELVCSQLLSSNIYYGVNDHRTTLVHAVVEVFDINDTQKRIGFVEGTFEVTLS